MQKTVIVGNDFVVRQPRPQPVVVTPTLVLTPVAALPQPLAAMPAQSSTDSLEHLRDLWERLSFALLAVMFLAVSSLGVVVGGNYWEAHVLATIETPIAPQLAASVRQIPRSQLQATIQSVTKQPIALTVGDQAVTVPASTVNSWLQVIGQHQKTAYLRTNNEAITKSLTQLTAPFVHAPVNQVSSLSGGAAHIIVPGKNGTSVSNVPAISQQIADNLLKASGLNLQLPLQTASFAIGTVSDSEKLLEVNLTTKHMYAYEHGNLVKDFLISAGKPTTPTPLGQFHIWQKVATRDMRGRNPDGSKYFQPHVRWVNYFDHSGDAVHGNYWRQPGTFGTANTSHGCVSLPDDQAQWVYDWAPIGTTVINYKG